MISLWREEPCRDDGYIFYNPSGNPRVIALSYISRWDETIPNFSGWHRKKNKIKKKKTVSVSKKSYYYVVKFLTNVQANKWTINFFTKKK